MARFNRFSDLRITGLTEEQLRRRKCKNPVIVEGFDPKKGEWVEINSHTNMEAARKEEKRIAAKILVKEHGLNSV